MAKSHNLMAYSSGIGDARALHLAKPPAHIKSVIGPPAMPGAPQSPAAGIDGIGLWQMVVGNRGCADARVNKTAITQAKNHLLHRFQRSSEQLIKSIVHETAKRLAPIFTATGLTVEAIRSDEILLACPGNDVASTDRLVAQLQDAVESMIKPEHREFMMPLLHFDAYLEVFQDLPRPSLPFVVRLMRRWEGRTYRGSSIDTKGLGKFEAEYAAAQAAFDVSLATISQLEPLCTAWLTTP